MISLDRSLEVNPPGTPEHLVLDRNAVWGGLVRQAENAVPFVGAITSCRILERDATGFTREIVMHGEPIREHIVFHPKERVDFVRLSGSPMGKIENRIEESAGKLMVRFVFDLEFVGTDAAAEEQFRQGMEASYLDAVRTTLDRIRAERREAVHALSAVHQLGAAMEDRIRAMFAAADRGDASAFLEFLTADASFTFGNHSPAIGAEAIAVAFNAFIDSIGSLRHEFVGMWNVGNVWIVEQRVHYIDAWGRLHDLPCTNVLRCRADRVYDYRIYMDVSPLFMAPAVA
jgi:ketosteroid isomerase-like protein